MPEPDCFLRYRLSAATRNFTSGKFHVYAFGGPPLQRGVVLKWFYSPIWTTFVGGTCALLSALLVIRPVFLYIYCCFVLCVFYNYCCIVRINKWMNYMNSISVRSWNSTLFDVIIFIGGSLCFHIVSPGFPLSGANIGSSEPRYASLNLSISLLFYLFFYLSIFATTLVHACLLDSHDGRRPARSQCGQVHSCVNTDLHAGESILVQKWNSLRGGQVHLQLLLQEHQIIAGGLHQLYSLLKFIVNQDSCFRLLLVFSH